MNHKSLHVTMMFVAVCGLLFGGCEMKEKITGKDKTPQELAKIHNVAGVSASVRSDYATAAREFGKAVELDDKAEYYNNLGRSYYWLARYGDAMKAYLKAEELGTKNADLYANMGDIFLQQKNQEKAIAYYHKAVATDPNNVRAHFELGDLFLKRGDFSSAEERLTKAIQLEPTFYKALLDRAILYRITGRYEKAYYDMLTLDRHGFDIQPDLRGEILDGVKKQKEAEAAGASVGVRS